MQLKRFNSNNRDYTYKKYENEKFVDQSVVQSLFNGSQFMNCDIERCDFSRCDYEGMNITNTSIKNSNYKNADIKSVVWKDCIITNCIFDEAYISNNIFINCVFNHCSFENSVFLRNTVNNTQFNKCIITQSTFSLSSFNKCIFNSMSLGDCSFYKQILNSCEYNKVSMNIDSLGQVYGLNQKIMENMTYIFLGKEYGSIKEFSIERLINAFECKEWLFEEIFLKYNYGQLSNYELITSISNYFLLRIGEEKIIKQDELDFCIMVIEFLKDSENLPLFALIYSYQILYEKINMLQSKINDLNFVNVKAFMSQLLIVINEMLDKYYSCVNIKDSMEAEHIISLHYENSDIIYFHNIINELDKTLNLNIHTPAKLIEVKQGTYIEIILAAVLGITALQFFLYGINGVLLQLIDLKAKWKVLKAKNSPNYIMSLTRKGKQLQPEACGIIMNSLKDRDIQKMFVQYAAKLKDTKFISDDIEDTKNQ